MKQKIEMEIDIPRGWEFVRYDVPNVGENYLGMVCGDIYLRQQRDSMASKRFIVRKIKQWRDPILPADWGKEARFGDDGKTWLESTLLGWTKTGGTDYFNWLDVNMTGWQFCQVCDEGTKYENDG